MQTTATMVDTCGEAGASTVSLFPTVFAPAGVLRLTLTSARARCTVNRSGSVLATSAYQITVQHADPVSGYSTAMVITRASGTEVADPLAGLLSKPVGGGHVLGDYINSWSLSPPSATTTPTRATASVPGALKLLSQPLRNRANAVPVEQDPLSAISLTLGAVGCAAEDAR
jgi:hypothetical protein